VQDSKRAFGEGTAVWRAVYYRFKPAQEEAFWKDFAEHRPFFELAIQEGIMLEYKLFKNPTKHDEDDWDVMLALIYADYAALDRLEAEAGRLYLKYFGSAEAVTEAAKNRAAQRDVLGIHLWREVSLG
jgi:hypothetical protein